MSGNKPTLLGLPDELKTHVVPYLDREPFNALRGTNKSLHVFLSSNDSFFDKWPKLDDLFCEQDKREVVHLVKSPDNKKLCAVIRRYMRPGKMIVFDIKKGPINARSVNDRFQPVFSPGSDLIIAGAPSDDERGILIGRITTSAYTRASSKDRREIINWSNAFINFSIRGATFINQEQVWISHRSGRDTTPLSPSHVYSFKITRQRTNKNNIDVSTLSNALPQFTFLVANRDPEDQLNVNVVHKYPYTTIKVDGLWTLSRQLIVCKHIVQQPGYKIIQIPFSPRLDIETGIGMNVAFSTESQSLIGVGCDRSHHSGRIVTFFDEEKGHRIDEGPYQNFTEDLRLFDEYGPPKIWYYDGKIIVYSKRMIEAYQDEHDPDDHDETQLTATDRIRLEWNESCLSSPRAYYVRGKVPEDVKEKINRAQINMTYAVRCYYDTCELKPFLVGWTPEMWNLVLNGIVYV